MDTRVFEAELKADGFLEVEIKSLDPRPANGEHGHHFCVRGVVLDGAFIVTQANQEVTYRAGDVFFVPNGDLHCEAVGPEGARILVGRRY